MLLHQAREGAEIAARILRQRLCERRRLQGLSKVGKHCGYVVIRGAVIITLVHYDRKKILYVVLLDARQEF